jgi:hypothetical protein
MSWWKEITGSGKTDTSGRMCEKGHPMDPNWKTCAYCEAEARATQKTVRPETSDFESSETKQGSMTMGRSTTKIYPGPEAPEEGGASETRFDTSSNDIVPPKKAPPAHQRRLTGVLVTFKWKSQGELFPLYEGRNVIGSKDSCDVCITTDKTMSGEHAVLLCRAGRDELHDLLSTNGTFLNEEYVVRDGADLTDGALIKTGATVFEFRKFTSGSGRVPERPDSDRHTEYKSDTVL